MDDSALALAASCTNRRRENLAGILRRILIFADTYPKFLAPNSGRDACRMHSSCIPALPLMLWRKEIPFRQGPPGRIPDYACACRAADTHHG
ncbi:MAG: hypothetical protein WBD33_21475, partial [Xanthobacteraceae bacterium]